MRDTVFEIIAGNGLALKHYPQWQDDKDMVLAAVTQNVNALEYASSLLKGDADVVRQSVIADTNEKFYPDQLQFADDELMSNKAFVMELVAHSGMALKYASEALKDDEEVVEVAVRQCGFALFNAIRRLRNDKRLVLLSVKEDSSSFQHHHQFKNDIQVVTAAMNKNECILQWAHRDLYDNDEFMLKMMRICAFSIHFIGDALKNNQQFLNRCVEVNPGVMYRSYRSKFSEDDVNNKTYLEIVNTRLHDLDYCIQYQENYKNLQSWVKRSSRYDAFLFGVFKNNECQSAKEKVDACLTHIEKVGTKLFRQFITQADGITIASFLDIRDGVSMNEAACLRLPSQ